MYWAETVIAKPFYTYLSLCRYSIVSLCAYKYGVHQHCIVLNQVKHRCTLLNIKSNYHWIIYITVNVPSLEVWLGGVVVLVVVPCKDA